jgi:hypothetical protein
LPEEINIHSSLSTSENNSSGTPLGENEENVEICDPESHKLATELTPKMLPVIIPTPPSLPAEIFPSTAISMLPVPPRPPPLPPFLSVSTLPSLPPEISPPTSIGIQPVPPPPPPPPPVLLISSGESHPPKETVNNKKVDQSVSNGDPREQLLDAIRSIRLLLNNILLFFLFK